MALDSCQIPSSSSSSTSVAPADDEVEDEFSTVTSCFGKLLCHDDRTDHALQCLRKVGGTGLRVQVAKIKFRLDLNSQFPRDYLFLAIASVL